MIEIVGDIEDTTPEDDYAAGFKEGFREGFKAGADYANRRFAEKIEAMIAGMDSKKDKKEPE